MLTAANEVVVEDAGGPSNRSVMGGSACRSVANISENSTSFQPEASPPTRAAAAAAAERVADEDDSSAGVSMIIPVNIQPINDLSSLLVLFSFGSSSDDGWCAATTAPFPSSSTCGNSTRRVCKSIQSVNVSVRMMLLLLLLLCGVDSVVISPDWDWLIYLFTCLLLVEAAMVVVVVSSCEWVTAISPPRKTSDRHTNSKRITVGVV